MNSFLKRNFIVIVIFVIFLFIISQVTRIHRPASIKMVKLAGQSVVVDVATEDKQRMRGLSGRNSLGANEGMLFVFDDPDKYSFWMKDMNFPIDIIWIGEDMRIVYIKKNALPELYPEKYEPTDNAKYVLEVVSGFAAKNNLKVGDGVEFTY